MRPFGSPKTLERRRRRAMKLLKGGVSITETARRVGASISSVLRWQKAHRRGGDAALAPKPVPGRPVKLRAGQCRQLLRILSKGARAWGFSNEIWTLKRIVRVIRKEFGIKLHQGHVWKVLQKAGWTCQVPERRAIQRDEKAIAHWKRYKWPPIKKSPRTWCPPRLP